MRVIDVGCGPGIYVKALLEQGVNAVGIDVDPRSPYEKLDVFSEEFLKHTGGYDVCLCLEVAEHLPEAKADEFVRRLTLCAETILFSAAQPGQGGHGHINCQTKKYWADKFANHNYVIDAKATDNIIQFVKQDMHLGWFINNVMVFKNYGSVYYDTIVKEETPQANQIAKFIKAGGLS